jgi:hypothetical protein
VKTSRLMSVLTIACAVASAEDRAVAASPKNPCRISSRQEAGGCVAGAVSDQQFARSTCSNLADATARKACRDQAGQDFNDAVQTCNDQSDARLMACSRLGLGAYDPAIDPAHFVAAIDNPFMPLKPGTTFVYEGQTAAGLEHNEVAVTHNTKTILGVTCVEVHDTVTDDGVLTEDTLDWFAQDTDGNVWYFGENSKQLTDGLVVGVEGSWTGGEGGAKPGIVMKAHPTVGDFYRQEFLVDVAEDLGEVVSLNESVTVPAGSFTGCLKTADTSTLEPGGLEHKFYAPNVGNVLTVDEITGEQSALIQVITAP